MLFVGVCNFQENLKALSLQDEQLLRMNHFQEISLKSASFGNMPFHLILCKGQQDYGITMSKKSRTLFSTFTDRYYGRNVYHLNILSVPSQCLKPNTPFPSQMSSSSRACVPTFLVRKTRKYQHVSFRNNSENSNVFLLRIQPNYEYPMLLLKLLNQLVSYQNRLPDNITGKLYPYVYYKEFFFHQQYGEW